MSIRHILSAIVLLSATNVCVAHAATAPLTDALPLTAPLQVSQNTQIPGKTLKPGMYTIRVVDHLSDRVVLRVEDAKGHAVSTFLGLEASGLRGGNGPLLWANGPHKTNTVRGYSFPGGATVEFVYAKADAVSIAKVNAEKVAAIDPASEGRVAANHLSGEDLQMVTLWTLSATRVGPAEDSQPAIAAERYQTPQTVAQTAPMDTHSEQVGRSIKPSKTQGSGPAAAPAMAHTFANRQRMPVMATLPHTASYLPILGIAAILLLSAGMGLRARQTAKTRG